MLEMIVVVVEGLVRRGLVEVDEGIVVTRMVITVLEIM